MDTPGITPDACARTVMETVPMVMRCIRAEMRRHGAPLLSVPQFRALAFLDRSPGACLSSVADHLGVATATVSVIIDRLVRRGLLVRADDPRERRRLVLTLTPAGVQHLDRARSATRSWMAELPAPLAPASLRRIAEGVDLLGGHSMRPASPMDGDLRAVSAAPVLLSGKTADEGWWQPGKSDDVRRAGDQEHDGRVQENVAVRHAH